MARFLAWRLAATLFVLLGVAAAVFTLMNTLPGDPATMLVSHFGASAKDIDWELQGHPNGFRGSNGMRAPLDASFSRRSAVAGAF